MTKLFILVTLACVSPLLAFPQDISGFWKGTLQIGPSCFAVNNIELQIYIKGNSITGSSYHYLDVNNFVKKNFIGTYNAELRQIYLEEQEVTIYNIPSQCKICIKKYTLNYKRNQNKETLEGGWTGVLMNTLLNCESGVITLSRIKESAFKEIPEIVVDTGKIKLDFYDNGVIDGDSISIKVNNIMVLTHQRLSDTAITIYVTMDLRSKFQEVEMIAENLGSIPPNTALLVITAAGKRYELFLTASDTKTARVRFVWEKTR
ncbi:MAG: hypothetical protein ABI151_03715 [Chitinophagaceae bacterium]